jgi:hypothetical protein
MHFILTPNTYTMNWYLAKIVYRIICGTGEHKPQFDEQLRLIGAQDPDTAFQKAVELGQEEGRAFLNHQQELVRWHFLNVTELHRLDELVDGAELYSHVTESEDPDHYTLVAHERARRIRENIRQNLMTAY